MQRGNFEGENFICMAHGWLKEQNQQFFCSGIRTLENCQSAFQLQETILKTKL